MNSEKIQKVADLAAHARELQLEGVDIIDNFTLTQLADVYNGIGSDKMPAWIRKILDFFNPSLEEVALIHDCEWQLSDKTKESFTASNQRFERNGLKVADLTYKWYDPRRYYVRNKARKFAWACQNFGWEAWVSE